MRDQHLAVELHDSVATAIRELSVGESVSVETGRETVTVEGRGCVEFDHEIALRYVDEGEVATRYWTSIGDALVGDRSIDWATDQLWSEVRAVFDGRLTLSEALGERQFAIHRIGPST